MAASADIGERDDTYHALVDCGSVEIVMAAGADNEADKEEHTKNAVMWILVAGKYANMSDIDQVQADSEKSVQRLLVMADEDESDELLELLSLCQELEPVVEETYAAL